MSSGISGVQPLGQLQRASLEAQTQPPSRARMTREVVMQARSQTLRKNSLRAMKRARTELAGDARIADHPVVRVAALVQVVRLPKRPSREERLRTTRRTKSLRTKSLRTESLRTKSQAQSSLSKKRQLRAHPLAQRLRPRRPASFDRALACLGRFNSLVTSTPA
jgi:hypothetical protein